MSLLDLRDDAEAIVEAMTEAKATLAAAAATGTPTRQQLHAARATFTGLRGDVDDVRAELDAVDCADALLYDDGAALITAWRGERGLRHTLVVLAPKIRAAETMASRLLAGAAREVYVTKQGDTWQRIAARFLGDWKEWTRLAEANGMPAGPIASGTTITIPPRR